MRTLYISQNGMLENLGQSQVLPYLRGLARRGVEVRLLSYELEGADDDAARTLSRELHEQGITWTALRRRKDTRLRVKIAESGVGALRALSTAIAYRPDIVHGRSYFSTAVCDIVASTVPGAKLLFDCRGMIGDEYVDSGHWTESRVEYKLLKRYESRAFRRSEGVVVLTNALRDWVRERSWVGPETEIVAIPCCVDLERFRFDEAARVRIRRELGAVDDVVLVYSGSLGSWYREDDIARFAGRMKRASKRRVHVLVLSPSPVEILVAALLREGIAEAEIHTRRVPPREMAAWLSASDVGISFIKSCFSKKGSSPTKVAEYLACGLPVILNGDIGDQAELREEPASCVVLDSFTDAELDRGVRAIADLAEKPLDQRLRDTRVAARDRFGLEEVGVARYAALYRSMTRG